MDNEGEHSELERLRARVAEYESSAASERTLNEAVQRLLRGGAAFVGHDFFPAVVQDLASVLEAEFVFVGRLNNECSTIETVALWGQGQVQENITYELLDTPCANVVGQGVCSHDSDVTNEFPRDQLLIDMGIEGYVGVPLFDARGNPLGIIVALYQHPIANTEFASTVMMVFAARTAAEMERVGHEEAQRELEARVLQAQKLESLGVLAGGIAHDFNNILVAILGGAELVRQELPATHPALADVDLIAKTSQQAAELCGQLLAYAGKGRFELANVDLTATITDVESLLRTSASKYVTVEMDLSAGLPTVRVDVSQIRQVLLNLVVNASEAIGEASGSVRITTGQCTIDEDYLATTTLQYAAGLGDCVFFEVSDTGHGMTSDVVDRIFDPFFTTKFTGRGLGLAAILGIIRGHSGSIKVYSEPGKGTSFKVLLPVVEGAIDAVMKTATGTWKGEGTVLVIDDDSNVRHVASRLLNALGFETLVAEDGRVGVEAFRQNAEQIRLVLLDLTMPNMSGEAALGEVRKIRGDVPVVLMSGFSQQDTMSHFVGDGLSGFLQKPFSLENITQAVRAALDART